MKLNELNRQTRASMMLPLVGPLPELRQIGDGTPRLRLDMPIPSQETASSDELTQKCHSPSTQYLSVYNSHLTHLSQLQLSKHFPSLEERGCRTEQTPLSKHIPSLEERGCRTEQTPLSKHIPSLEERGCRTEHTLGLQQVDPNATFLLKSGATTMWMNARGNLQEQKPAKDRKRLGVRGEDKAPRKRRKRNVCKRCRTFWIGDLSERLPSERPVDCQGSGGAKYCAFFNEDGTKKDKKCEIQGGVNSHSMPTLHLPAIHDVDQS